MNSEVPEVESLEGPTKIGRKRLKRAPTFELASKTVKRIREGRVSALQRVQQLKEARVVA